MVELSTPVVQVVIEGLQVQFLSMSNSKELAVEETIAGLIPVASQLINIFFVQSYSDWYFLIYAHSIYWYILYVHHLSLCSNAF